MYSLTQIKQGVKNPKLAVREINKLYSRYKHNERYNTNGIDIFEEDWDNLVLLDACRYDEFDYLNDIPGELEYRISRGSTSPEFIRGNFSNKSLNDTVYVSANRFFASLRKNIDAEVYDFIPTKLDAPNVASSLPDTVTDAGIEASNAYPNKRLIIHYLQPHQPYLSPKCSHLENKKSIKKTIAANSMSRNDVQEAYRENLIFVLNEVRRLLEYLEGKTVISADHGELLGERQQPIPIRDYGHPEGIYTDELVKVPWLIHNNQPRKDIHEDKHNSRIELDENINKTLKDLGYRV